PLFAGRHQFVNAIVGQRGHQALDVACIFRLGMRDPLLANPGVFVRVEPATQLFDGLRVHGRLAHEVSSVHDSCDYTMRSTLAPRIWRCFSSTSARFASDSAYS